MARAPQRIPRRTALASRPASDRLEPRSPAAPAPPHLRLVDPNARRRVHRRRWLVRLWAVGIVVAALSGVMVHALMAQAQMRVDQVDQATAVEQRQYQASRLLLARLESPNALVKRARDLGLIDAVTTRVIPVPEAIARGLARSMRPATGRSRSRPWGLDEFQRPTRSAASTALGCGHATEWSVATPAAAGS